MDLSAARAVLFDKDGTLFDFQKSWRALGAAAIARFAGEDAALAARLAEIGGYDLAGGRFQDSSLPNALRAAGIRTAGLVVLFQGEQHWKSHPESRPLTASGELLFKDRWYAGVCPNQPWLRREKLTEIEQMLRSGWYDYINLDFIRYPVHWEVPAPRIPDTREAIRIPTLA